MSWKQLSEVYKKNGIVLALGAGVSMGSHLPNWRNLLHRLVTDHIAQGDANLFERLTDYDFPLPVIASLLEENSPNRIDFVERVREALYRDFPFFPDGVKKGNRRQFIKFIRETNPTLQTVASLCAVRNPGKQTYSANPRVNAIVSFNLDALLQAYVYARYEKRLLRTIDGPSAGRRPDKINIYHMHGYLRFDRKAGDPTKEAPHAVILTEQDYFDFFNDSVSLFSYTFLYLLREYPCLFIGLSMQDENIRRLLHYSKKERILALKEEGAASVARQKALRHFAILKRSGLTDIDNAIEQSLLPLGTSVLWIEDYVEIPEQIETLYRSDNKDWDLVY